MRRRSRKRVARGLRLVIPPARRVNHAGRWTSRGTPSETGRAFRTLNVVEDFTRECPVIEVSRSIPGSRVVRLLDRLALERRLPELLVMDNGPEFAGESWTSGPSRGVKLRFITPGRPVENAYIERFNGKFATSA